MSKEQEDLVKMKKKSYFQEKINKYKRYGIPTSNPDYSVFIRTFEEELIYIQGCKDVLAYIIEKGKTNPCVRNMEMEDMLKAELEELNND